MRKLRRSRRLVKKLLKRAVPCPYLDAYVADGKRLISAVEVFEYGLKWEPHEH